MGIERACANPVCRLHNKSVPEGALWVKIYLYTPQSYHAKVVEAPLIPDVNLQMIERHTMEFQFGNYGYKVCRVCHYCYNAYKEDEKCASPSEVTEMLTQIRDTWKN